LDFGGVKTGLGQLGVWFVGRLWACGRDVAGLFGWGGRRWEGSCKGRIKTPVLALCPLQR